MTEHQLTRRYVVPDHVAWVDGGDFGAPNELYLTVVPSGETVLLTDTGRLIWMAVAQELDPAASDEDLPRRVRQQVSEFLASLEVRRLVRRRAQET